jgi:anaerobic magnesium-protoporphyrin IX monomethyl ester cyclase
MKRSEKNTGGIIDVLLTYPSDPVRLFDSMVPLGLASIAAVLEANSYKVKVIDFNHYKGDYRKDLRAWQPKIVGIGGTTATRRGSFLTARLTKEVLPSVPVVYGGPHASFTARDTLTHVLEIDYVVKGEGEYPFLALCDHFAGHQPIELGAIKGL